MITAKQCLQKYGEPGAEVEKKFFELWDIPADINLAIPHIANKLYCNKDLHAPLEKAFRNMMAAGVCEELKTWDGCYNIRKKKGSANPSLHSWGIAIDVNAAWNGWMQTPTLSPAFAKCFKDAGFDWGGDWLKQPDGMHFQLAKI